MRLSSVLSIAVAVILAIASAGAATLVLVGSRLHGTASTLGAKVEETRLVEQVVSDLLLHERTTDSVVRARIALRIRSKLANAGQLASTPEESRAVQRVAERVDVYLEPEAPGAVAGTLEAALAAAGRLVDQAELASRRAQERASVWSRMAELSAAALAVLLVFGVGAALLWVRAASLRPIEQLRDTLGRYAAGERELRAPETGTAELREIARAFNELAATLARQRRDQLTFLAAVAHDLGNPLNALVTATAVLDPSRPRPSEDVVSRLVALVRRQVRVLARMVHDLLDTARIENGQLALKLGRSDVREVVRETVELFADASPIHRLEPTLSHEPLPVLCDPGRIVQVLGNLVSNAIKYSPHGGPVQVAAYREGRSAVVSVADQGIGISAADLPTVFEPFRRTGASRELVPGVGLGLAVSRRIVERHGGRLEVHSELGAGSTFLAYLPLDERAADERGKPNGPATAPPETAGQRG